MSLNNGTFTLVFDINQSQDNTKFFSNGESLILKCFNDDEHFIDEYIRWKNEDFIKNYMSSH